MTLILANFEGYAFSPNYDIAMIMFNFPCIGSPGYDALRSGLFGTRASVNSTDPSANALQGLDTEVITNAIYGAPQIHVLEPWVSVMTLLLHGVLGPPR